MKPKAFVALVGFIVLAAGTFSPLLRPFSLVKWDMFDLNKPYGLVLLLMAVIGVISVVMSRVPAAKIVARLGLLLVVLLYVAALLKVHSTFSFIPFKGIAAFMSRQIKFTWGWLVLFAGALLSVLGTAGNNRITAQ